MTVGSPRYIVTVTPQQVPAGTLPELQQGALPFAGVQAGDITPVLVSDLTGEFDYNQTTMQFGWNIADASEPVVDAPSESIRESEVYRFYLNKRCLITANGFYQGGVLFHLPDLSQMFFAGLWREEKDGQHFVLLTAKADKIVRQYHERMPLVLSGKHQLEWVNGDWKSALDHPSATDWRKTFPIKNN